jgi:predicted NUDIX family NTP pyrophosphohydrolase
MSNARKPSGSELRRPRCVQALKTGTSGHMPRYNTVLTAGVLPFRFRDGGVEVLLVRPRKSGRGPKRRAWQIPKGQVRPGERTLEAARRELWEEAGLRATEPLLRLDSVRQRLKTVHGWAMEAELVAEPTPGPEIAAVAWMPIHEAREEIVEAQIAFLDRLLVQLGPHREV